MCDEKVLREVFAAFDTDKSGTIDAKELKAVIRAYFQTVSETADESRITETAAVSFSYRPSNCSNSSYFACPKWLDKPLMLIGLVFR